MIHIVSITFTALILTELLMVVLTIRTWHWLMLVAILFSMAVYVVSLAVLHDYFGESSQIVCDSITLLHHVVVAR